MKVRIALPALALLLLAGSGFVPAHADDKAAAAIASEEDGKYFDAEGNPTFKFENGTVDWYTFSGYRRYHSDCHVCHGPDGVGSSYAPALADSLKTMDYGTFISIVAEGRKNIGSGKESVMPAFVPKSCVTSMSASAWCAAQETSSSTLRPLRSLINATARSSTSNGFAGSISPRPHVPSPCPDAPSRPNVWPLTATASNSPSR